MAAYEFEIGWPVSLNSTWRPNNRGRFCLNQKAVEYREKLVETVKAARDAGKLPPTPILESVTVCMAFYPADNRVRDIDNLCKNVFDSMNNAKVWNDDSQVNRLYLVMCRPSKPAHVKIFIVPSGDEKSRKQCFDWLEKYDSRAEFLKQLAKNVQPKREV